MKQILLLSILALLMYDSQAQQKNFPPRNETNRDPDLYAFVNEMKEAIHQHDTTWFIRAVDPKVESSIDSELGKDAFMSFWDLKNTSSPFWEKTAKVIAMGGVFIHEQGDEEQRFQFVFPYTYDIDLGENDDPYYAGIITGKNVNLREKPTTNAKVLTQLSYQLVSYVADMEGAPIISKTAGDEKDEWFQIETADKRYKGWINSKFIYQVNGPRMFLYKDQYKHWRISAFMEGD